MGRLREGQYFCFCLDHVREYNATYNYFNGMSDEAVLRYQKDALTGHRPTWKMGANRQDEYNHVARTNPFYARGANRPQQHAPKAPKHGVVARKALACSGSRRRSRCAGDQGAL